ncbi:hypothetical protein J8L70_02400 [Pseudoalteromonas sp. MMG010]|uniref:DVU3141 family protein n=1 Tax=Pseudoalteromonas sp. MMG010 TaxID=2822685 RepID=UPI001B3A29AD|nr:DVU3141 family protein [Pseudoalteromonas sp. MMG010]MBQ4832084.1 hypothetical protein [Pseudoalteromonas sp. MMG010]
MMIDDKTLNAFLDNELSETQMEQVRHAIAQQEDLALRLAELSEVDMLVKQHAQHIDNLPLSHSLANTINNLPNSNVVEISRWQKLKTSSKKQLAIAASVAIACTVSLVSYMQQEQLQLDSRIVQVLEKQLSGDKANIDQSLAVTANLSFINNNGEFCRQYTVFKAKTQQAMIACKQQKKWQMNAQGPLINHNQQSYSMASHDAQLDNYIDETLKGQPLDRSQEQHARSSNWQ